MLEGCDKFFAGTSSCIEAVNEISPVNRATEARAGKSRRAFFISLGRVAVLGACVALWTRRRKEPETTVRANEYQVDMRLIQRAGDPCDPSASLVRHAPREACLPAFCVLCPARAGCVFRPGIRMAAENSGHR